MAKGDVERIVRTGLVFFLLSAATMVVPLAVYLDIVVLGQVISETGFTELCQEVLILASSLLFIVAAVRRPEQRGFLVLVAGCFAWMFFREMDYFLGLICRDFWQVPAGITALVSVGLAVRWRKTILPAMAEAAGSLSFVFIQCGMVMVVAFSRVFGTGTLWRRVMDAGMEWYAPPADVFRQAIDQAGVEWYVASFVKNIIQEGLELLGYVFILFGSILFYRQIMAVTESRSGHRAPSSR